MTLKGNYWILRRKIDTEIGLQMDYEGDMEVSLYNIWVEFETTQFEVVRK